MTADAARGARPADPDGQLDLAGLGDAARRDGVESALADLHHRVAAGGLVAGAAGHALAPAALGRRAERIWPTGTPLRQLTGVSTVALPAPLRDADLLALRGLPVPDAATAGPYRVWLLGLAWLRLGVSAGLVDRTRAQLAGRQTATGPLLRQQLVRAALAEAVTEQLTVRALLADAAPESVRTAELVRVHRQLTAADHALLPLLGAAGFTAQGPGRAVHLSHLLADVYLPAEAGLPADVRR